MESKKTITQHPLGDTILIVHPPHALDNDNAHEMVNVITTAQAAGYTHIIVDMIDVAFLSSAGVGSILGTVETSREMRGDIVLCNVAEPIRHILDVLDLSEYLTLKASAEEAAAACGLG